MALPVPVGSASVEYQSAFTRRYAELRMQLVGEPNLMVEYADVTTKTYSPSRVPTDLHWNDSLGEQWSYLTLDGSDEPVRVWFLGMVTDQYGDADDDSPLCCMLDLELMWSDAFYHTLVVQARYSGLIIEDAISLGVGMKPLLSLYAPCGHDVKVFDCRMPYQTDTYGAEIDFLEVVLGDIVLVEAIMQRDKARMCVTDSRDADDVGLSHDEHTLYGESMMRWEVVNIGQIASILGPMGSG